jgi:hypothetical protein
MQRLQANTPLTSIQDDISQQPTHIMSTIPKRVLRRAPYSEVWKNALLPYLGTRFVLFIVGLIAQFYFLPITINAKARYEVFPQALWLMWERFDSTFYLRIARLGYGPSGPADWAFYPFYPLLIHMVGTLFGGSSDAFILAGLLISNLAGITAITYLYLLVRKDFNSKIANYTVLYLAIFPMSFFLSAVYTEALFLALAIACIYYARKQSWWLAGLCGGCAALTRAQGVMLIVPVLWEYLRATSERYAPYPTPMPQKRGQRLSIWLRCYFKGLLLACGKFKTWLTVPALALIPGGLFAFMLYSQSKTGDLMTIFHVSKDVWGRQLSSPLTLLIYSLQNPIFGDPLNWNFWTLNMTMTFAFLGFTIWSFRRLPMIYALYSTVMVVLPLSSNYLNSISRYYLLVFPAFILLALFSRDDRPNRRILIMILFLAIQALLTTLFITEIPIIA